MKMTINVTIENGKVTELETLRGPYSRTEIVASYEDPITVNQAAAAIREELIDIASMSNN